MPKSVSLLTFAFSNTNEVVHDCYLKGEITHHWYGDRSDPRKVRNNTIEKIEKIIPILLTLAIFSIFSSGCLFFPAFVAYPIALNGLSIFSNSLLSLKVILGIAATISSFVLGRIILEITHDLKNKLAAFKNRWVFN